MCLMTFCPDMKRPIIQWSVKEELGCMLEKIIVAYFNIKYVERLSLRLTLSL